MSKRGIIGTLLLLARHHRGKTISDLLILW